MNLSVQHGSKAGMCTGHGERSMCMGHGEHSMCTGHGKHCMCMVSIVCAWDMVSIVCATLVGLVDVSKRLLTRTGANKNEC